LPTGFTERDQEILKVTLKAGMLAMGMSDEEAGKYADLVQKTGKLELKIERLGLSETDKAGLKEGKKPASMSQTDFDSIQVDYNAVKSD